MKKIVLVLFSSVLMMSAFGCQKKEVIPGDDNSNPVHIENIDYKIKESEVEGQKGLVLSYTNHTKYTMTDVEIVYKQKEGLKQSDLSLFDEFKKTDLITDQDLKNITMSVRNKKFVKEGETVEGSLMTINMSHQIVTNKKLLDVMEPVFAIMTYIGHDQKMHVTTYDFASKEHHYSKGRQELFSWSSSKMASRLPKPQMDVVESGLDNQIRYTFGAFGVSRQDVDQYIKACQEKGFTQMLYRDQYSFRASNSEGAEVCLIYNETDEFMSGSVGFEE